MILSAQQREPCDLISVKIARLDETYQPAAEFYVRNNPVAQTLVILLHNILSLSSSTLIMTAPFQGGEWWQQWHHSRVEIFSTEPSWLGQENTPTAFLPRGKTPPPTSVLDITLNNLMMRLQYWSFEECEIPLHCHYSLVHSDPLWSQLIGSCLWTEVFDHLTVNKWPMFNWSLSDI